MLNPIIPPFQVLLMVEKEKISIKYKSEHFVAIRCSQGGSNLALGTLEVHGVGYACTKVQVLCLFVEQLFFLKINSF